MKIRSFGSFKASRQDNKIYINGKISHTLVDKYNFNDDTVIDKIFLDKYRDIEKSTKAKSFFITGATQESLDGILEINENNQFKRHKFQWNRLDKEE